MAEYRKILIDGKELKTRGNPCRFLVRQGKKMNGGKKGRYYLDGQQIVFWERKVLPGFKCAGIYRDRKLTKETSYSKWLKTIRKKECDKARRNYS